jgi:hypothetical protein
LIFQTSKNNLMQNKEELEKKIQEIEDSKNRLLSKETVPLLRIFIEVSATELQIEAKNKYKKLIQAQNEGRNENENGKTI